MQSWLCMLGLPLLSWAGGGCSSASDTAADVAASADAPSADSTDTPADSVDTPADVLPGGSDLGAEAGPTPILDCAAMQAPAADGSTTYWVRPDGGTSEQCTGLVDAAYPGTGTGQPCAFEHPFWALPPGGTPVLAGGDQLVIAPGSYAMGYGAPGSSACDAGGAFVCTAPPLPAGPDAAHPTRIRGVASSDGTLPELYGVERADQVLNLTGSSHVRVECLEITDHSECVEFHSGRIPCQRDEPPYGEWAVAGVLATDAEDVTLRQLDIHGLGNAGMLAGRLADLLLEDVRIANNGWVGFNGEVGENSSDSGSIRFKRVTIEWNGCGETADGRPTDCWAQEAGGYGDGLGTTETGGDWTFEDCRFLHNTSDGLDLLYHNAEGSVTLDRVWSEGNAGNQIKVRGEVLIRNTVMVGTCGFFHDKPFSFLVDDCRAYGNVLALDPIPERPMTLVNSTLYSEGSALIELVVPNFDASDTMRTREDGSAPCDRLAPLTSVNNIFLGSAFFNNGEPSSLFYRECGGVEEAGAAFDNRYGVVFGVSDYGLGETGACPDGSQNLCADPLLDTGAAGADGAQLAGMRPATGSPAIDSGTGEGEWVPDRDIQGTARPLGGGIDRGAFEQ